jgi:hypothetical protein
VPVLDTLDGFTQFDNPSSRAIMCDLNDHENVCLNVFYPLPLFFDLPDWLKSSLSKENTPFGAHPLFRYEWHTEPSGDLLRLIVLCQRARLIEIERQGLPRVGEYLALLKRSGLLEPAQAEAAAAAAATTTTTTMTPAKKKRRVVSSSVI